ncbi:MerR family transcriptional regulator [Croceicoccus sp. YJ47]|uniref:MerR family transcriptional regulator n=1 Tax=Croceicoccus sp. YJ47 TaxID=2798724 RepID=UPI001922E2E7|nr:MerR family transcriptional regulator [Croceicoccus sp. YJ47]QQN74824.1 MerR family transcriptional regulator [Croceicoccus sp. YJ47]
MNIFYDRFTTGQVVTATELPNHTLQSWLKRDLLIGKPGAEIEGGGASGAHRKFTFFTVMEIAIAKALTDAGLSAAHAIKAAQHFAHMGEGPVYDNPGRCPGLPFFNHGMAARTLLCVAGDRSIEVLWKVKTDVMPIIRTRLGSNAFTILEVDEIFENVVARLGYHPTNVMQHAYKADDD